MRFHTNHNVKVISMARGRGFTLLEVLVALAIFSVCALSLLQQSGRSTRHNSQLETKLIAHWISQNEAAQAQLDAPRPGTRTHEVEFAKRHWQVSRETSTTADKHLFKVRIQVSPTNNDGNRHLLTTYVGKY